MYPTIIELFGVEISSFGVMVGIAFLVGGFLAARSFERAKLSGDDGWRVTVWALVGGILGSKLWYAFEHLARGDSDSLLELVLARGGLTWYGGLVGGVIASVLCIRIAKLPWLTVFNCAAPSLAIGQALGRVGCFLVGDDYGYVTDVPWGVAFPQGLPPTEAPVHPTMLYEVAWLVPVFAWLWSRRGRSPFLFGEYLFLAGLGRLWIEAFRTNPELVLSLSNAQVVALVCMATGAASWLWFRGRAPTREGRRGEARTA